MAAKVEFKKDSAGEHRWHVKAANGEIVASGEGFDSKAGARQGFETAAAVIADVMSGRADAESAPTPEEYEAERQRLAQEVSERNAANAEREAAQA